MPSTLSSGSSPALIHPTDRLECPYYGGNRITEMKLSETVTDPGGRSGGETVKLGLALGAIGNVLNLKRLFVGSTSFNFF